MDRRFLHHYNTELLHLRQMAAEFAVEYPKIAGRLALDPQGRETCPDPFVERLLEGFAFLTARIQVKFDAEFPRLTQALLETVYPDYLSPTPSMAIVRFEPDLSEGALTAGFPIPRGTALKSHLGKGERTACEYRTAHPVTLLPLVVEEADYHTRDLSTLRLPETSATRAAIRIRLRTPGQPLSAIKADRLVFYLAGSDELPAQVYEQLFAHTTGLVVKDANVAGAVRGTLPASALRRVGFDDDEALLPPSPRTFQGYRILREYFAFPQRFLFFEIGGLAESFARCPEQAVDLVFTLGKQDVRLERRLGASTFELFCTPAVNLFPKRFDRILLSDQASEFHAIPDRIRPLDFEVYRLDEVTGLNSQGEEHPFRPFYLARDTDLHSSAFYTVNRTPRPLSEKERRTGPRSINYIGSEVHLSLVDATAAPYPSDLAQLAVRGLCTNRHLPIQLAGTEFSKEIFAPVNSIRCITGPTLPRQSLAQGEFAWRIISHLSLNYLSLADSGDQGAVTLRELLKLYCQADNTDDRAFLRQIEGVRSIATRPVVRALRDTGQVAFARGLEVSITFEESFFEGTGAILLGGVLDHFFSKYVSLNSFTETVVKTKERGEIIRWPLQTGKRPIL